MSEADFRAYIAARRWRVDRPIFAFAIAVEWQAHCGGDAIGPRRHFMIDAIADLPPEANVSLDLDRQTYGCDDRWRIAPRHSFQNSGEGALLFGPDDFRQRRLAA